MAPALTKITKDGHGIHLSSPLASSSLDSDGGPLFSIELEPQEKLTEDSCSQKMWLNSPSLPFLHSPVFKSCLDFPDSSTVTPMLQASDNQYKTLLLQGPGSLLSLLSLNKSLKDPPQGVPAHPGAPSILLVPVSDHNSQEASLRHRPSSGPEVEPDGGDVPLPPPPPPPHHLPPPPPLLCHQVIQPLYSHTILTPQTGVPNGEAVMHCPPASLVRPYGAGPDSIQCLAEAVVEEVVSEQTLRQLSRQADLLSRAGSLQQRLLAVLGQHASVHYRQQLEGVKRRPKTQRGSPAVPCGESRFALRGNERRLFPQELAKPLSPAEELREFGRAGQALLRGLQEALDSDATASSSSEDEPEKEEDLWRPKSLPICRSRRGCERRWQEERAEVGSRWSWLDLRLAELEERIQQLGEVHKHIASTKGGVVLAESQPLTDRQIQQILLKETAGLCCTAGAGDLSSDADNEPSSPTRLLRNIERQSAQLSQFVNSLMPPLNLSPFSSPLSKPPQGCKGLSKRALDSSRNGDDIFFLGSAKRIKIGSRKRRQLIQADASCVCARTRPLVTYHKPRLFTLPPHPATTACSISYSLQDSETSTSTSSSSSSSFSCCPACSSCDPLAVCCKPALASGGSLTCSRLHPVLSVSSDTHLSHHLQSALARENWLQKPLTVLPELSSPAHYHRLGRSSTPLPNNTYRHNHRTRHARGGARGGVMGGVRGLSPVRWAGFVQTSHQRDCQTRRKRRHAHSVTGDEEDFLHQLSEPEESSGDGMECVLTPQASHTRKHSTQGPVRRRQGESVYSIDNIVIPMSLAAAAKVEKLQYKDIITPSWRKVIIEPLEKTEGGEMEREEEALTDEDFARKHEASEEREKLRWSFWDKNCQHRRSNRSGSRSSGSGEGLSGWECPVRGDESSADWSWSQLDSEDTPGAEECLPRAPWERRVFPLREDEEEALHSDAEERPEGSCTVTESSGSAEAQHSKYHVAQLSGSSCGLSSSASISPSAGRLENNSPDSKIT